MPPHRGFGLCAIAGADGRDDGIVLMHRFFRDLAAETGAEDMDMDMQPRQRIRDQVIARALRDQAMEFGIHVGKGVM